MTPEQASVATNAGQETFTWQLFPVAEALIAADGQFEITGASLSFMVTFWKYMVQLVLPIMHQQHL